MKSLIYQELVGIYLESEESALPTAPQPRSIRPSSLCTLSKPNFQDRSVNVVIAETEAEVSCPNPGTEICHLENVN